MGIARDDEIPGLEYNIKYYDSRKRRISYNGFFSLWGLDLSEEYDEVSRSLEIQGEFTLEFNVFDTFYIKRNGILVRYKLKLNDKRYNKLYH